MKLLDTMHRFGLMPRGMFRCEKLTRHANGAPCMHCGRHGYGDVVPAHSNWSEHGKGERIKAHDCFVAFMCDPCHRWLDQGSGMDPTGVFTASDEDKRMVWRRAHDLTMLYLFQTDRLVVR